MYGKSVILLMSLSIAACLTLYTGRQSAALLSLIHKFCCQGRFETRHFLRNRPIRGGSAMTTGEKKVLCQCFGSKLAPNRKQFSVEKSRCISDLFSLDV